MGARMFLGEYGVRWARGERRGLGDVRCLGRGGVRSGQRTTGKAILAGDFR